ASGNAIGGASANVISGNGDIGVLLYGAGVTGNTISANYIGTGALGLTALANGADGVVIQAGASFNSVTGNVLSGNAYCGLVLDGASNNSASGNYLGVSSSGAALANGSVGVYLVGGASANTIGGPTL